MEVELADHSLADRIPAWINFTSQNSDKSFDGVYIELNEYEWKSPKPAWINDTVGLKVYECHIGMCGV